VELGPIVPNKISGIKNVPVSLTGQVGPIGKNSLKFAPKTFT